jgi:hypothetical protein
MHEHNETGCSFCNMPAEQIDSINLNANQEYLIKASAWISQQPAGFIFTADDMAEAVGAPPSTGITGSIFRAGQRTKIISSCGYTEATRKSSHSRIIRKWIKLI